MTIETNNEHNSTKSAGSIPPAIFVSGCEGNLSEEINGLYCIACQQVSPAVDMKKWRFCYHKGGDVVKGNLLCYGENCPELGEAGQSKSEESKGLIGWIIGRLVAGQIKVIARCVQRSVEQEDGNRKLNAKGGFTWEVMDGEELKEMESMSAQPLHAGQKDASKEEKKPNREVSPTSFVKRQLGLEKEAQQNDVQPSKGPSNPIPALGGMPGFNNYLFGGMPTPGFTPFHLQDHSVLSQANMNTWSKPFNLNGDANDTKRAGKPSPNSTAPSGSVSPNSRKLRAEAPAFVPGNLTPVLGAVSPTVHTIEPAPKADARGILIEKGKRVVWDLGKVAEELKNCEPGEGVESSTFCLLKNDNLLSGPPMKLTFYPFGHVKSSPGCLAVSVECIEKARMKFKLGVGSLSSGPKVLLGNKFHVDLDASKVMAGGMEDGAVLQAWKFDKLSVHLTLEQWIE